MESISDLSPVSVMSNDELVDGICTWAGRIAAGTAQLLAFVAELDRREAWAGPGMLSCAHWLSWRIGLSPGTAREWVRVAHRLTELPAIRTAFEAGRMSWSQVRAVTRVAEPGDGVDWVELARHSSADQLERIVRGIRRAKSVQEAAADPDEAVYRMRTRHRYDADGNLVLTIYAPAEDAPVILAGLEAQRAEIDRQRAARAAEASAAPEDVPAGTPEQGTGAAAGPPTEAAAAREDVPAGTPTLIEKAFPEVSPQALQDAIAGFHAFVATLTDDHDETDTDTDTDTDSIAEADADADAGSSLEPTTTSITTPAEPGTGVPAGTPVPPAAGDVVPEQLRATDGDALLALACAALDTQRADHPEVARRTRSQLVVQVDPLSSWARLRDGELLPPTSLTAVMKTLPGRNGTIRLRRVTTADLTAHDLGRTTREPSLALRELLGSLDGERCRFPGCTRHRKLHAHHVVYWSADGATDLANLLLLCSRHHTLVHQLGFQLALHPDRRLEVHTADGVPVLHHPAQPWGDPTQLDPTGGIGGIGAKTLPPTHCDSRLDLGYAVSVLLQQAA